MVLKLVPEPAGSENFQNDAQPALYWHVERMTKAWALLACRRLLGSPRRDKDGWAEEDAKQYEQSMAAKGLGTS